MTEPDRLAALQAQNEVALFRRLFRGRVDVDPVRRESKTPGKSGHATALRQRVAPGHAR